MIENSEERPLVTFALFAYNQERFIREAVEGALAQTYSPLQVILSDDCSSDRTFEIMQGMVADYSGPHEILLNRNERNLGIGGHINRVMELVKGELIIGAAGDDISLSCRSERIVRVWLESDKQAMSIYSCAFKINKNSENLGVSYHQELDKVENIIRCSDMGYGSFIPGASHAWSTKVFDYFGPLLQEVVHEDNVIPLRSVLLGKVIYINQPLIKYRVNNSSWLEQKQFPMLKDMKHAALLKARRQYVNSKQTLKDLIIFDNHHYLGYAIKRLIESIFYLDMAEKNKFYLKNFIIATLASGRFLYKLKISMKYIFPKIYYYYMLNKKTCAKL